MGMSPRSCNVLLFSLVLTGLITMCLSGRGSNENSELKGTWKNHAGLCYFVNTSEYPWEEVRETCRELNGDLVDITNNEEKSFVLRIIGSSRKFWIGLYKNETKAAVSSVSDELIEREICYAFKSKRCPSLQYKEMKCSMPTRSICVKGSPCASAKWKLFGEYCYLAILRHLSWHGAYANCLEKGAKLASWSDIFGKNITSIDFPIQKQWVWIGTRSLLAPQKPIQSWMWLNGTKFDGLEVWTTDVNTSDSRKSCATLKDMVYLAHHNCKANHSFICKTENIDTCRNDSWIKNGSSCYLFKQDKLCWDTARKFCAKENAQLLTFTNASEEKFVKEHLSSENFSVSYWLGLYKNHSEIICGWTERHDSNQIYRYSLRSCCPVVQNDGTMLKHHCLTSYNFLCVAEKYNETDCPSGWTNITKWCFLVVHKFKMSWVLSRKYCDENNASLSWSVLSPNMKNIIKDSLKEKAKYWIYLNRSYIDVPTNPVNGWVWVDQSNLTKNDSLGAGVLYYTGWREKRCGAVEKKGYSKWQERACSQKLRFICKANRTRDVGTSCIKRSHEERRCLCKDFPRDLSHKVQLVQLCRTYCRDKIFRKFLLQQYPTLCSEENNCEKIINETLNKIAIELENQGKNESQTKSAEDLINEFVHTMRAIVGKDSFNLTMNITHKQLELAIFTNTLAELLRNGIDAIDYFPLRSVEYLCQNVSSCIVKRVILKMKNIKLNTSPLLGNSSFQFANVVSLDCFANGHQISDLQKNEFVEIKFGKKKNKKPEEPHCVYLNGSQWTKEGMGTRESSDTAIKCSTKHLSSFAMVVTGAQLDDDHKKAFAIISYVGSALSLTGLSFTLLCYVLLHKDLHVLTTTRNIVHLNLQLSLGLTQIIFLAGAEKVDNNVVCKMVAILLHYFSLASFCWMLLEGAMLYLKVISVFGGTVIGAGAFFAFGWGFPLFFVGLSALVNIDGYGTAQWCWLSYDKGYFWVFFAPVIIITTLNLVILFAVMKILFRVSKKDSNTKQNIFAVLRGLVILFPALGLSWVFGVVSANHDSVVWKYLFAIFNSLQGFLVFIIYGVYNQEIRYSLKRRFGRRVGSLSTTHEIQVLPAMTESKM